MNGSDGFYVPLRLTPSADGIFLRSLNGADELSIEAANTKTLVALLDSLIQGGSPDNKIHAAQIVTADRDRLLAMLYMSLYGSIVESTINCMFCHQKFDLDFSLDELLRHYQLLSIEVPENGLYTLEPGISFRLPTGEDEMLISAALRDEQEKLLLERCLVEGNPGSDNEKVQLKMAEMAPVLSMEMEAVCPECNHSQPVHFDIQSYFLTKLMQERPLLIKEIHLLALQYHWSYQEIMQLPRKLRKQFAAMIQSEN